MLADSSRETPKHGRHTVKRSLIVFVILIAAAIPAAAGAQNLQPHFTGHRCTISTCRYFTSSYHTAIYYYDRQTCNQWKSLSSKYLNGFRTVRALHNVFPHRKLHPPC